MKQLYRAAVQVVVLVLAACSANAAEYSEADDIPATTSLLFTPSAVAISVEPYAYFGYQDTERALYFSMDRSDAEFRQVSREQFAKLSEGEHVQERTRTRQYVRRDYEITYAGDCENAGYCCDSGPRGSPGRRTLRFDSVSYDVCMLSRSSIVDTILHGSDLWIATYESGDHGEYGAEGVLVASSTGASLSQIDVGRYPVENLVKDPWSSNIWIVTRSQLTLASENKSVKSRYWKYYDFDHVLNQPKIFVTASNDGLTNNPLAVLARWLGESSYDGLAEADRAGVKLLGKEPLYNFAMFGNYFSHHPYFPPELAFLMDSAKLTHGWRRFACLSHGELANELCNLELEEWPDALTAGDKD